jgi:hypothetical protein
MSVRDPTGMARMLCLLPTLVMAVVAFASAVLADERVQVPPPLGPATGEHSLLPNAATGQWGSQLRTNVLPGKSLQAGPTVDIRPNATHREMPAVVARGLSESPVELGGFVGYLFGDDKDGTPPSSLAVDLQFATDPQSSGGGWLVQPGIDYTTPLSSSWHLTTRLFSTYAPDSYPSGLLGPDPTSASLRGGSSADPTFQDVGVGLGLGYQVNDNWNIQTQARYQRMLGSGGQEGQDQSSADQFFGGVMIDYRF